MQARSDATAKAQAQDDTCQDDPASQDTDECDLDNLDTGISAMLGAGPDCSSKTGGKTKVGKSKAGNARLQQQGTSAKAKGGGVQKTITKAAKAPVKAAQGQGPGGKASSTTHRPVVACSFMDLTALKLLLSQWEAELQEHTSVKVGQGKKTSQEVFVADAKVLSENLQKLITAITTGQPDSFEEDALLEYARD